MIICCLVNMEHGSSARSTEDFLKILRTENLLNKDVRIPCYSTVTKYNRALPTLAELQVKEFVENSKSLQIGFGESANILLISQYFQVSEHSLVDEHFPSGRTYPSQRTFSS